LRLTSEEIEKRYPLEKSSLYIAGPVTDSNRNKLNNASGALVQAFKAGKNILAADNQLEETERHRRRFKGERATTELTELPIESGKV